MLEFCGWSPLVSDELLQRHVYWLSAQMKWFALSVSQHQASGSRFTLPSKPLLGPQEGGSSVQSFVSVLFFCFFWRGEGGCSQPYNPALYKCDTKTSESMIHGSTCQSTRSAQF